MLLTQRYPSFEKLVSKGKKLITLHPKYSFNSFKHLSNISRNKILNLEERENRPKMSAIISIFDKIENLF
jgi:hypothetical protein